jgi:hypothetical protein
MKNLSQCTVGTAAAAVAAVPAVVACTLNPALYATYVHLK